MFATVFTKAKQFATHYNNRYTHIALAVLGVFIVLAVFNILKNNGDAQIVEERVRAVSAQAVGDITGTASTLAYTGTVRAREEAEVRAQKSGVITSVNYTVGAYVPAGAVIASIQNNAESASVQSAQASLAQAQANLEKIKNGTRNEQLNVLAEQANSAQTGIVTAHTTARNALLSAYASVDNAFPGGVDVLFSDPRSANPQITLTTTNYSARISAQNDRVQIGEFLKRYNPTPISDDAHLDEELQKTEQEVLFVKDTLDKILQVLAGAVSDSTVSQTQIDSYTTTATTARASILSALSSIASAKASLSNARTAFVVAQQQQNEGVTGARPEDIKTAEATVAQAQAGLYSAQAQFANTRITAPISGTLTTLSIKKGSFAQQFGLVGTLANTRAREVVVYVPPQRVAQFVIGTTARINDTLDGVVTEIAKGIATNATGVEVRVAVTSPDTTLTDGDTALVTLTPTQIKPIVSLQDTILRVPVSALKLKDGMPFILAIVDGHAEAHAVSITAVEGDVVAVRHSLSNDSIIITDARGVAEGDAVTAQQ